MKTLATMTLLAVTLSVGAAVRPMPSTMPSHAARSAPAQAGTVVAVAIQNGAFAPGTIEVAAGTTVEWTNRDPMQHSVTAKDGSFDSGLLDPDAKYSHTFETAGTYEMFCTPHPFMKITVVVR